MKRPHLYREGGRWKVRRADPGASHRPRVIKARNRLAYHAAFVANGTPRQTQCRLTSWVNWCPCHGWCL